MTRLAAESCDFLVSIPMKGRISSLNASAAAAILLYEAVRQRDNGKRRGTGRAMRTGGTTGTRNYTARSEQEDEHSLEAILAEYGKGGRQPAQTEQARAAAEEAPGGNPRRSPDPVTGDPFRNRKPADRNRFPNAGTGESRPRRTGWR